MLTELGSPSKTTMSNNPQNEKAEITIGPDDGAMAAALPLNSRAGSQEHLAISAPVVPKALPGAFPAVTTLAVVTFVIALNSTCLAVALPVRCPPSPQPLARSHWRPASPQTMSNELGWTGLEAF